MTARRTSEETLKLAQAILAARSETPPQKWTTIEDEMGIDQALGQFLIKVAAVKPRDRIAKATVADPAKFKAAAQALRAQRVSKAEIAARAGVSVAAVRNLLGKDDHTLPSLKPAAPKPTPAAKPKAAKKAAAKPAVEPPPAA